MRWQAYIESNDAVLGGEAVLRGTQLSVEFLLERLTNGWSVQYLHDNYPELTPAHVQAVFAYGHWLHMDRRFYTPST